MHWHTSELLNMMSDQSAKTGYQVSGSTKYSCESSTSKAVDKAEAVKAQLVFDEKEAEINVERACLEA